MQGVSISLLARLYFRVIAAFAELFWHSVNRNTFIFVCVHRCFCVDLFYNLAVIVTTVDDLRQNHVVARQRHALRESPHFVRP